MDKSRNRILVVDDEEDVLETLEELLDDFIVDTAASFQGAVQCLKANTYDAAVLDIMGVKGYDLLEATRQLGIPTLMLTAHALTPGSMKKSLKMGADAYVPKEKIVDIPVYIEDLLDAGRQKRNAGNNWFARLTPFFAKLFGKEWQETDKEFWEAFDRKNKP